MDHGGPEHAPPPAETAEPEGSDPSRFPAHPPPLVMPGDADEVARETAQVGVEGEPADPKVGPGAILLGLAGVFVLLVIVSLVLTWTVSSTTGVAVFAIGSLGLVFNPVVTAALMRARDKQDIVDEHRSEDVRARSRR